MNTSSHSAVCFGEILWDVLPSGAVPGGAPMNVGYHLKKLGLNPALITRVGLDDWGKKLINITEENNLTTEYFQLDYELGTGLVNATIGENHEVTYEILKPVAWDSIQLTTELTELCRQANYFIYGSLAARSETTHDTLMSLREVARYKVLDINLRAPFYDKESIEELLEGTDLLKMNLSELELITGWFNSFNSDVERVKALQDRFNIESIVVTKGGDGALLNYHGTIYHNPGIKVEVADTVGSGDAFLAGLLYQLSIDSTPQQSLDFASALGAFIATQTGACPKYSLDQVTQLLNEKTKQTLAD